MVYRIGSPLGLSYSPSVTFLDLPREIRDRVYHDALVAMRPITFWSCSRNTCYHEILGKSVTTDTWTVEDKDPVLDSLATALFTCNSIVSREALERFYRYNIFHVTGSEIWNPMYTWLNQIGTRNKQHLRNITADMPHPEPLGEDSNGTLVLYEHTPFCRVHSFVDRNKPAWYSHYVDPAIEACFRNLGEIKTELSLKLQLGNFLPGAVLWEDEEVEVACNWVDMDIPNEIERVRELYADHVDVLWQCQGRKSKHNEQRELMQRKRWEIVDEKVELLPCFDNLVYERGSFPQYSIIQYLLRRNISSGGGSSSDSDN